MDLGLTHPMIVGELACGTARPRLQTLSDIELLRPVTPASVRETIEFIERENSTGSAADLWDMILLTSTLITPGATPWTLDKRLATLAERFEVAHRPGLLAPVQPQESLQTPQV